MSNWRLFTFFLFAVYIKNSIENQYENREILQHEERSDILNFQKTVFQPKSLELAKDRLEDYTSWNIKEDNVTCSITPHKASAESNGSSSDDDLEGDEKLVLTVQVNITEDSTRETMEEDNRPLVWHNGISKGEIRQLQSKVMRKYMNPSVDPCKDFYSYACGNWKKYFEIPPDRSSYDTFEIIRENLDLVLKQLLQEDSSRQTVIASSVTPVKLAWDLFDRSDVKCNDTTDATVKAKFLYQSCMNMDIISRKGPKPLLEILDLLGGWPLLSSDWCEKKFDLFLLLARLRLLNNDVLISQWVGPDMKNANQYIVHIDQTTLGLPGSEYFLDAKNLKYIRAYKIMIVGVAQLLGADHRTVDKEVDDLVDFETALAQIIVSNEERRNISDIYLKTDLASMTSYFPQYEWPKYFDLVLGLTLILVAISSIQNKIVGRRTSLSTPVAVYCVKYLLDLVRLLSNTCPRIIQNYLIWRFVRHRLNNLDSRFLDIKQRFNFVLYGREQQPPRWQFCVTQVNSHMGMALGSLFVQKYFDQTSKMATIEMTHALMDSFKDILRESTWIDAHTKKYAKMKLENMDLKIGFPDFILNTTELSSRYFDVNIHPDYFFENVLSILRHLSRIEQKRLGSEVNRTLWSTTPAVVNAYYSRNKNQIMFPAGILQPPFFHKHFPKALNFGGIGVVIGHEITHGFDDKGRLFDQRGNLMMWWRECSIRNFYERAQCMIDQYNQYILPQIKTPLDGFLTQGENIADNGGLKESFRAYKKWLLKNQGADESLPDLNLTGRQLFFLNFAQVWCGQQKIEEAKSRIKSSVHAPGIFRIIGVLSNSEDFAREFNCPLDSPMNPEKKCAIW